MLKRMLLGLLIGFVVGAGLAAALVKGFGVGSWAATPVLAYLFAAITGAITGMVAGKPIWARGGAIEAGLKAVFGALIAAGAMFALRQWAGGLELNLSFLSEASHGPIGDLPAAALPAVATVLGAFYGLDNTPSAEDETSEKKGAKAPASKKGVPPSKASSRVAAPELDREDDELDVSPKKSKQ